MSEWIDRFENHQIHAQIQQINALLEQVGQHVEKQSDAIEDYNRLTQIITFVMVNRVRVKLNYSIFNFTLTLFIVIYCIAFV